MAGIGRHDSGSLRNLLDEFVDVHKNDMLEITSGHLNESKLWNPLEESRVSWVSAKKPAIRLKTKSKLQNHSTSNLPPLEMKKKDMSEAVMDFMIGPSGGIRFTERPKNTTPVSPTPEPSFIDKDKRIPFDHHLTQELELPELMLPVYKKQKRIRSAGKPFIRHEFIATHHSLPTKSDQFNRFREFEERIINKTDAVERRAASGQKDISRIERKLRKKLSSLEARHIVKRVPSFYTLQAYSESWNELIEYSEIYGKVLKMIKDEYDSYISTLLDLQETQNGSIFDQLNLLSSDATATAEKVKTEEKKVDELEKLAMEALEENESLRQQLKEEERIREDKFVFKIPDRSKEQHKEAHIRDKKKDLEEQVEDLHHQIESQLNSLENLKCDRKENYVPRIVCQRMEQCIKETELEIQKLLKQNGFLESNIESLEAELEDLIEAKGTSDRDTRLLWMKINTSKVVDSENR